LTSTAARTASEDSHVSTKQHLETLRTGGKLDRIGHVPDWTDRYSNPKTVQLLGSFHAGAATANTANATGTASTLVKSHTHSILSRPEQKSGGIVYTDALRWYKPPPGVKEIIPKKLRLAPAVRPSTVPIGTSHGLSAEEDHFPTAPAPIPLSQRRFPDLNLPFSTIEQNPTANYTAIHSAMAHNVNNA
jgi:hypothetical protein